ncbi:MAG: HAD family hydrolase [Haloarculaceae archaeon]
MPSPSPIDAVVFDLDGTLARHDQEPASVLMAAFAETDVTPFCDADDLAEAANDVVDADSDRDFFRQTFRLAAERHAGPTDRAEDIARAYDTHVDHTRVSFREGAERALDLASEVGPVGLITNGQRENQLTKLRSLGIQDRFDASIFAGDDTPAKPDPRPFRRAIDALGVPTAGAYYVGNSLRHDVVGAKTVGLGAGWYPNGDQADEDPAAYDHQPDHTFDTLHDLEHVLNGHR